MLTLCYKPYEKYNENNYHMPFIQLTEENLDVPRVNRSQATLNKFLIQFIIPEIGKNIST